MKSFLAQTRKAAGVAVVGLQAWGAQVLLSSEHGVTTSEWVALTAVAVAVAACYGLTNDSQQHP